MSRPNQANNGYPVASAPSCFSGVKAAASTQLAYLSEKIFPLMDSLSLAVLQQQPADPEIFLMEHLKESVRRRGEDASSSSQTSGLGVEMVNRGPPWASPFNWKQYNPPKSAPEIGPSTIVEFLTDVEGNWRYFMDFVAASKVLFWDGDQHYGVWGDGRLSLRDDAMLVFGGDVCDKGPGDIRFGKLLLDLKFRYPSRVFLIIGNRDINKFRWHAELAPDMEYGSFHPPWEPKSKPYATYLKEFDLQSCTMSALRWMLDCNMGCQKTTFLTRKAELAMIYGKSTDENVLNSFRASVDPHGNDPWILDYVRLAQMAVVIKDALFIHGGVTDSSLGALPGEAKCDDVHTWVAKLNAWKDAQVEDYLSRPGWRMEGGVKRRGGDKLIEYGTPGGAPISVVYFNPFNDGNPQPLSKYCETCLVTAGIRRVLSGHQPHGQSPTVVRHPDTGLLRVTGDTSYSDMGAVKTDNPSNNRGDVMSVVRLHFGNQPRIEIEGRLADGSKHRCSLHTDQKEDALPDALVGRQLTDGSWVKTVGDDGSTVVTALGHGFSLAVQNLHFGRACLTLKPEYAQPESIFDLPHSDVEANWMVEPKAMTKEWLPEAEADHFARRKTVPMRQPMEVNSTEFHSAETYLFAVLGVIHNVQDETGRRTPQEVERGSVDKVNALIRSNRRVLFVTNNSNHSRREYVDILQEKGVVFSTEGRAEDNVVTTSFICATFLKLSQVKRPFVVCSSRGLLDELRKAGITDYVATCNEDGTPKQEYQQEATHDNIMNLIGNASDVDCVVVGWDQYLTTLKVAVAAMYVRLNNEIRSPHGRQIQIVACSRDTSGVLGPAELPGPRGSLSVKIHAVGNGTMAQAVCAAVGPDQKPIDVGKPSTIMVDLLRRPASAGGYGVDFSKAVMIGDTLETDIRLANHAGMRSLLVLSGVTHKTHILQERNPLRMPTWVANTFADID